MAQDIRIGQILIEQGVLNEQQVFEVIEAQKKQHLPFGILAERMFEVSIESIERAWVEQYLRFTGEIDLNEQKIDVQALKLINRRQAWQFEILPLRYEATGELLMAASASRLARAVAFAAKRLKPVVYFRVAQSEQVRKFLAEHYPMPEVSDEILNRAKRIMTRPAV